jgi:arylsulfatase A-like enzyme
MKLLRGIACCLFFVAVANLRAQTTRPIPQVDRLMIISIDGLRPDVMLRGNTPNLHKLMDNGSFSMWAQTVPVAITLPSHVSMLTGVVPEKHGINFNDERATTQAIYPNATTLFEIAHNAGYTTALISGKAKFEVLAKPGTVDWLSVPNDPKVTDADVADRAGSILRLHKPKVTFVHFPGVDTAGHAKGWASPEQFAALAQIDESIGMLLHGLETSGLSNSTIVIVTADHGGSGRQHGAGDVRSLCIPWIACGPGVKKNYDLTLIRPLTVNTTDTFATACFLLGIQPPEGIDGKAIEQIVEGYELLHPSKPTTAPTAEATPTGDGAIVTTVHGRQ